jgi:hypothetical protein
VWDKAGAGEVLRVHGAIVAPATQYSPEVLWGTNSYASTAARRSLGPADGRVCYLTQLTNITGSNFRSLSDEIKVYSDGTTWWLHGSGRASGAARCADITSFHGGNGGTNSGSPHTLGGSVAGKTCWLSAVGGDFRSTDQFNGVFINNLGSAGWSLTVSPGKKASAGCGI